MLLFRNVFVGSSVALAFVAGLVPSVTAAPWWPMHYVMAEIPPDQAPSPTQSTATAQLGITSTIEPVSATVSVVSAQSSAAPEIYGTSESLANASMGSDGSDAATQQTNSATLVGRTGATSVVFGSTVLALYLAL
ncbi:hypothetical protein FOMPIDRAFT_1062822 [Fomitopsis schrenkii]|uniref:Uncharacterized protein n=1 Tax=Fomitopsis schrenkii TaxID=2126942 RepID=S8F954_FOMSC|nr:hypothetical protein FOMPIDRAFT_1062822 [Fomitopsis schrenkii]